MVYCQYRLQVVDLFDDSDRSPCKVVQSCNYCIHHLFAAQTEHTDCMVVQPKGHNFELPSLKSEFSRKSFVNLSLFFCINDY